MTTHPERAPGQEAPAGGSAGNGPGGGPGQRRGWRAVWQRPMAAFQDATPWLRRQTAFVRRRTAFLRHFLAIDLISRGMLFAAIQLLCFIPFLLLVQSLAGRDAATTLVKRFGLSGEAAVAVRHTLTTPVNVSHALTGLSWVFFVVGGIAAAGAIQEVYQQAFHVTGRGLRDTPRRVVWLAASLGAVGFASWTQPWVYDVGGVVLVGLVALVTGTAFWWFTMWLLLAGRRGWRELLPAAIATGFCWFGMQVVFRLSMSSAIVSNYHKYGSIGVVFALMSYLIAVGVVIILGATFGVFWHDQRASKRR